MTVYIDDAFISARVRSGPVIHDSRWCHMTADTTEELTAFAISLGLKAKYIQFPGTWKEHYDVTSQKRKLAVAKGAVEISYSDSVRRMLDIRKGVRP